MGREDFQERIQCTKLLKLATREQLVEGAELIPSHQRWRVWGWFDNGHPKWTAAFLGFSMVWVVAGLNAVLGSIPALADHWIIGKPSTAFESLMYGAIAVVFLLVSFDYIAYHFSPNTTELEPSVPSAFFGGMAFAAFLAFKVMVMVEVVLPPPEPEVSWWEFWK